MKQIDLVVTEEGKEFMCIVHYIISDKCVNVLK